MIRIPEPATPSAFARYSQEQKDRLVTQRQADYARLTGDTATLADCLLTLGDVAEATALGHPEAQAIREAIDCNDDDRCDCTAEAGKKYLTVRKVWSDRHGSMVNVYRCYLCGHMNALASPPDDQHAAISAARAEVDAITRTLPREYKGHIAAARPDAHQSFK